MLYGWFDPESGRPYVEGRILVARFDVLKRIAFMVDTGSDRSLLGANDALRIGLDYDYLSGSVESLGIGGVVVSFEEQVSLLFDEPRRGTHVYQLALEIAPRSDYANEIPSLLGRDVLDRWRMIYDPSRNRLLFRVVSADGMLPLR